MVNSLAFDPQGRTLASGANDNTVKLWDVRSGKLLRTLNGHTSAVQSVTFDPQGRMLASGSADNTVKLWEAQTGKLLRTLNGHSNAVESVAFGLRGSTLASGSMDNTVKLWEVGSGQLLRTLEGHSQRVLSVAFDPQGETLASGSMDNTVKLWAMGSGKLLRTLEGHRWVFTVAFAPDGRALASGGSDNTVKLWDVPSGKLLRTLEGSVDTVHSLSFSRDGRFLVSTELDFVLCFGSQVGLPVRTLFQGLFESFLARRNLTVMRYEPVLCTKGHLLNRAVVREAMQHGDKTAFCSKCGQELTLPKMAEPIQLTRAVQAEVESQRRVFEQAVFRVRAYMTEQEITPPECFISYAWGVAEHERWVEKRLATDLQKAGIAVLLDRWDNAQIGASVARFVERIEECGRVVVVGTPLYRQKAKNVASGKGSVVAAEWDLAGIRLLATEDQKRTVLPVLLAGEESASFPPLLRGRVYGDFRKEEAYFATAFDLILSLYQLPPSHPAVVGLRESLRGAEMR